MIIRREIIAGIAIGGFLLALLRAVTSFHSISFLYILPAFLGILVYSYYASAAYVKETSIDVFRYPLFVVIPVIRVLWILILPESKFAQSVPAFVILSYISGRRLRDIFIISN